MVRSTKRLLGYHLCAEGGEIGKEPDFCFDYKSWAVCYLKVDTGPRILESTLLITNPRLVQIGLGLVSFHTVVYFEIEYRL